MPLRLNLSKYSDLGVLLSILWVISAITCLPFSPEAKAAWIIVLCIGLWASEALPQWFTALLFFVLCTIADIIPMPAAVFCFQAY